MTRGSRPSARQSTRSPIRASCGCCAMSARRQLRGADFLQHLRTARLWLPDELPWWVLQPKLRPLYEWIRELHRDGERLPTMVIHSWVETTKAARIAERARIHESLAKQLPLLNVERVILGRQLPLI